MSLASQILLLAQRAAAESKSLRTLINGNVPTLSTLTTSAKDTLVNAINEVNSRTNSTSGGASNAGTATTVQSSDIAAFGKHVVMQINFGSGTGIAANGRVGQVGIFPAVQCTVVWKLANGTLIGGWFDTSGFLNTNVAIAASTNFETHLAYRSV